MITLVRCEAAKFSDFMAKKKNKKKDKTSYFESCNICTGCLNSTLQAWHRKQKKNKKNEQTVISSGL